MDKGLHLLDETGFSLSKEAAPLYQPADYQSGAEGKEADDPQGGRRNLAQLEQPIPHFFRGGSIWQAFNYKYHGKNQNE